MEEGYLVCVFSFCGKVYGSEAGVVFCGEAEDEEPYFWGEDREATGMDCDLDVEGDVTQRDGGRLGRVEGMRLLANGGSGVAQ